MLDFMDLTPFDQRMLNNIHFLPVKKYPYSSVDEDR
jgi:hypothetical protein